MKRVLLTLCLAWAVPARADIAVPSHKSWRDGCAVRLDAAARAIGLEPGARLSPIPLLHEDGTPNRVLYVKYASGDFEATAGEDSEPRADAAWKRSNRGLRGGIDSEGPPEQTWFRRLHRRFAKLDGSFSGLAEREFRRALDDCLQMGDPK